MVVVAAAATAAAVIIVIVLLLLYCHVWGMVVLFHTNPEPCVYVCG